MGMYAKWAMYEQLSLLVGEGGEMGYQGKRRTAGGYDVWEVMSALQKAVRRGQEEMALYWALELETAGALWMALHRLHVIAQEDVGLGDPSAVVFALRCLDEAYSWHRAKQKEWELPLGNAIMALCRARKSRCGDHFAQLILAKRREGWHPEVPDEARDRHTAAGRRLKRGFRHFVEIGAQLMNEAEPSEVPDPYKQPMIERWLALDQQQPKDEPAEREDDEPQVEAP